MDGWIVLYYCLELDDFTNYSQTIISPRLMRLVKFTLHAEVSNVNPNTYLVHAPPNVSIEAIVQGEILELLHSRNLTEGKPPFHRAWFRRVRGICSEDFFILMGACGHKTTPSSSQDCTLSTSYLCVFLSTSHCEPSVLDQLYR